MDQPAQNPVLSSTANPGVDPTLPRADTGGAASVAPPVVALRAIPRRWRLLPLLLAFCVPGWWTTQMPFQLDDYSLMQVARTGPAELYFPGANPKTAAAPSAAEADNAGGNYIFRLVARMYWKGMLKVCGGRADPLLFHIGALLVHVLTTWALMRVLALVVDARAAIVGAAMFALLPGGVQAVSWGAAAGDLLGTLFMVVGAGAFAVGRRDGRAAWALVGAVCVACAFASKEPTIALLPAALLLWLAMPARARSWRVPGIATALALGAMYLFRAAFLHTWRLNYAVEVNTDAGRLHLMPRVFWRLLAPWNADAGFVDVAPIAARLLGAINGVAWPAVLLASLALPVAVGALAGGRRSLWRLPLMIAALAAGLAPTLLLFNDDSTNTLSRTLYPAAAVLAAIVGVAVAPLFRLRRGVQVAMLLVLPLALLEIDLGVHVARTELRAGNRVWTRIRSLKALLATLPPDGTLVAVDGTAGMAGIPMLYMGAGVATAPPFGSDPHRVVWWPDAHTIDRLPGLRTCAGPLQVAAVADDAYRWVTPLVPGLPTSRPTVAAVPGATSTFRFSDAVPGRALAGVWATLLPAPAGSASRPAASCVWIGSALGSVSAVAVPVGTASERVLIAAPTAMTWLAESAITGFRLVGAEADPAALAPVAVTVLPEILVLEPLPGAEIRLGDAPRIAFQPVAGATHYHVAFDFCLLDGNRVPLTYVVPVARLEHLPDDRVGFAPQPADARLPPTHRFTIGWHEVPKIFYDELEPRGADQLRVEYRVEAYRGEATNPEALSAWRTMTLVRPKRG